MSMLLQHGHGVSEKFSLPLMPAGTDVDQPEPPKVLTEETHSHQPQQTYPGCYGLPYQDHNYGAPPPPTPPQSPPPTQAVARVPTPTPNHINGSTLDVEDGEPEVGKEKALESITDTINEVLNSVNIVEPSEPAVSHTIEEISADDDSVTRCICEYSHDDGYMICCDKCSVWQHIDCMGIDRNAIPDTYYCERCEPRPVDADKARDIQSRKREFLSDTSSSSETEIVTRYLDTSSGLNIIKKNGKKFRKKRKEKENDKLPKEEGETMGELPQVNIKPLLGQKKKKYKKFKKNKLKNENGVSLDKLEKVKKKLLKKQKENEQHIKKLKGSKLKAKKLKISRMGMNDYQPSANLVATPLNHSEDANPAWDRMDTDSCKYVEALTNMYTADVMEVIASRKVNGTHPDSIEFRQQKDQLLARLGYVTQVRSATSIYRKGLKAAEDLTYNQAVVEYRGMFMLRQQFDKEKFFWQKGMPFVLFYGKLDGLDICVDASTFGNEARFVRRSCTPNAEVRHFLENGKLHLLIFSLKEITKGAEITIPFDFNYQECNYNVECACSRNNCPVHKFFKKLESKKENNKLNNVIVKPMKKKKSKSLDHIVSDRSEASCPSNIHVPSEESSAAGPAHCGKRKRVTPLQQSTNTNNINTVEEVAQTAPKQPPPPQPAPPPTNHDENSNIEIEVDGPSASTEAEADQEAEHHEPTPSEDEGTSHDSKKKTREERKMEAIMKAFEKLEKREERRKEALARLDHGQGKKDGRKGDDSEDDFKEDVKSVIPRSSKEQKDKVPEEVRVKVEKEDVKESPVKVKVEEPPPPPEVKVKEEGEKPRVEKPKHKGKKSKRSTLTPARRRSRVSSLCSSISENMVSQDESSNSTITSTPCTPLPSDPTINPFGQAFKFPKTKKHLMNEWLTEKGQDVNKPLSVKTDLEVPKDETMFVKYLPSPHTSLSHMRRNSTNTTPVASATVTTKTSTLGQSMGSAKKRWLRQAMFETDSDTSSSIPNGGSLSPNCTIPSPSQSPVIDFVTPLKKRRLAWRESQDGPYPPTPSTPSSEFASPLDTPSSIINRSMSLDESKLRNGFNKVAFSPMTPVTPGVNLFEKISALSSNTEMPGYGKQESMESDVSESLLSPHRERRLTGESDSDSLLQPDVAPRHSVNNSVNSASSGAGLDDVASDVAMAEAEPSPSGSVDTVTTRANNVLVSNLSTTGCANMEVEKMEECDTSVEAENTLRRRSLEVAESQGAETDTDNSKVEASGSSKHLNNDLSSVVEPTPSEPSVQNVLVDSQGELSNCDADAKCESSVEPMEVCSASVSSVTNSDEKIGGNADSTENQVGLSRPERMVTSEQTVSCSNGGLNRNSSENTGGMDSTEPTPGVSGVVAKKKEDDSVSSSGSSLEEGEICDSDEERHNKGKVTDSSRVPESQGFEYEVSESDARDVRTDNVVDTSTHQDTASTTNPDQSQPDQPNNSLQADSTSGIPDHKDGDTTNNITSSTVSDSDGALELNSQVSTTDSMDNSVVSGADTASSSQIASSSTNFISSSQASSLSTTTTTSADSSPSNSNIGSSYSPLAGSHLTTKPTGVASSTHSPIRSMPDQPSSTSGPSPPGSAAAASHSPIQQQKKKVSLLEYRKRMKEKSTGSSCNSASSTPTKTPTSVSFGSPRVTTPTVSLAPLPLFESSSPGDVDRSPFRDPADAKWSQPTSVERVREQSLAERLKREFGVDADDDDEEKKSECQARRRLPTTPPPPPPPSCVSSLSRGSLSAVAPHGVKMPLTDEASTSNADILKSVNPEILKAVAAVFKGAQISNKPRPSLGLPPGPQPVPPTSLAQAIAGANGTRSPAQAKLPSLMSLQTYTQGAQAQTQFNNYQTNGGPVPNQPFPQTPPIHQPPSFNQNQGPFPAGPAQAPGAAQTFSPATTPVKYPAQAPSFNQNQAFNGQPNASFPPASSTTQPGQDQGFQGQTFQPNFPQGQFGQNNFNQQQQFGPNTSQFGAPPQNGQMVPPTSSSGPPQGWQNYNNFNNQSQVPPPPPPQKNSSGYSKQKYPRKNSGGFSRDRSHHGHRD